MEILDQLRLEANRPIPSAAEYIRFVQDNIQRMAGQPCTLDGGSTEKRALSLLQRLEGLGRWRFWRADMEKYYFAYGSNINLDQMSFRCPEATVVGPVTLENYELLFRGNGGGYGVATIAPKKNRTVHGLLWKIRPRDEKNLDVYEGFPHLYDKETVTVKTRDGTELTAMVYIMTREKERLPTLPSFAYYDGIREGFRQNGLPIPALQKALRQVQREVQTSIFKAPMKRRDEYER